MPAKSACADVELLVASSETLVQCRLSVKALSAKPDTSALSALEEASAARAEGFRLRFGSPRPPEDLESRSPRLGPYATKGTL